ncbi:MAG: Bug family tripartite tricarboxylate transporter substrate binding protein [Lautropia sp.]
MQWLIRAFVLALSILPALATAQAWPQKQIRFIIPYPPGGGADVLARIIVQKLSENLSQAVIVDNKPGGATAIGTEIAAKAPPDGYTMLLASPSFTNNAALYPKLPYDPQKDFDAVTLAATVAAILVVPPSLPVNNVEELIALAKSQPGRLNYAMATGSTPHLAGEMLKSMGGIDVTAVPYKGMASAYPDLLGGRIHYMFDAVSTGLPHVQAGKTKALGVSGPKRSHAAPNVPTLAETGLPGFEAEAYYGIVVPKGTPSDVIAKLNAETLKALADPATAGKIRGAGFEIIAKGPADFAAYMRSEQSRWAKLIKEANIKPE